MAWNPTQAVITPRAIAANLLTFITNEQRQVDALAWAGGAMLKPIKTFSLANYARDKPIYPLLIVRDDDDAQEIGDGDIISGGYAVTFEIGVVHANPDTALANARKYQAATCSMIANIPAADITVDTDARAIVLESLEVGFEPIKANESRTEFLQQFQIRASYSLIKERTLTI